MHLMLCPGCGGFTLFHRRPNGWRTARCHRHRRCHGVAQINHTSHDAGELQAIVMANRGERSTRDMLADWVDAITLREQLAEARRTIREAHPEWHPLKCARKARDQVRRERREAWEARNPIRAERRRESHPKWGSGKLARRARAALQRKADEIDRKPYTKGPHNPRYSAPDWVYGDDPKVYGA